jgi:arsenite methyltransferase
MGVRDRFMSGMARQLGNPEGFRGRLIGRMLNKGNRHAVNAAVSGSDVGPGQAVADVGFGGGLSLQLLLDRVGAGGHVHGVELSDTMLEAARRKYRIACADGRMSLQIGSVENLPIETASLDGLITVNTIYFVEDLELALREIARVLRLSGRVVVGLGDPRAMASMPFTAHGFRLRPIDEVTDLLKLVGFTEVRHERVGEGGGAFHLLIGSRAEPSH